MDLHLHFVNQTSRLQLDPQVPCTWRQGLLELFIERNLKRLKDQVDRFKT